MELPGILAEKDLGTLIYIIVVFLWVIGNLLSKSRKKKGRPRTAPIPNPTESSAERELREFLETIAGEQAEMVEEEEPEAPPPPPRPVAAQPVRRGIEMIEPRVTLPAPLPRFTPVDVNVEDLAANLHDGAPSMAGSFSTTLSSMGSLFKTTGLTMPSLRYALSSPRPRPARPVISRELLSGRQALRQAVAGRIVLGPPRALEPYHAETEVTRS